MDPPWLELLAAKCAEKIICRYSQINISAQVAVRESGRVYGVQGLRVADASVIPTVPAANTMWTTVMFADRIGRSIRDARDINKQQRIHIRQCQL